MQENIKDKLSGIPIDVSVEIQEAKRKRRQSSFPQLPPVLDANEKNMVRSMVSARADDPDIQMTALFAFKKRSKQLNNSSKYDELKLIDRNNSF